jgi:rubredoxin
MISYVCDVCGYIYDPSEGDPEFQVAAGTPWENLPEGWICPVCGAPKEQFTPLEEE